MLTGGPVRGARSPFAGVGGSMRTDAPRAIRPGRSMQAVEYLLTLTRESVYRTQWVGSRAATARLDQH
jgi:hypothetical protein